MKTGNATSLVLDSTRPPYVLYVGISGGGVFRTLDATGVGSDAGWTNLTPDISMMDVYDVKTLMTPRAGPMSLALVWSHRPGARHAGVSRERR